MFCITIFSRTVLDLYKNGITGSNSVSAAMYIYVFVCSAWGGSCDGPNPHPASHTKYF
jgi:hypothetical protein